MRAGSGTVALLRHALHISNCETLVFDVRQKKKMRKMVYDFLLPLISDLWLPLSEWSSCICQKSFTSFFFFLCCQIVCNSPFIRVMQIYDHIQVILNIFYMKGWFTQN